MNAKTLMRNWSFPKVDEERTQLTLRLSFHDYARLHALKEVYPSRSVNDILSDIIRQTLDEIVEALPSYTYTLEDAEQGHISHEEIGDTVGDLVTFNIKYGAILQAKADSEAAEKDKKGLRLIDGEQAA